MHGEVLPRGVKMFGDGRGQNDLAKYALEGSKCVALDTGRTPKEMFLLEKPLLKKLPNGYFFIYGKSIAKLLKHVLGF